MVRKYNLLAPASVRRGYYELDAELSRAYEGSTSEILQGIQDRLKNTSSNYGDNSKLQIATHPAVGLWAVIRRVIFFIFRR